MIVIIQGHLSTTFMLPQLDLPNFMTCQTILGLTMLKSTSFV